MTFPHLPYVVTEIFCMIFAASVLFRLDRSIGSEHEVRTLRCMIYAYFGMLVSDIFYSFFEDDVLRPNRWVNLTIDAVLILSITLGCYFWYQFIEDRLHQTRSVQKWKDVLLSLPLVFIGILDFLSIFTGWLFYLDARGHYQSTSLFLIQSVVNYFYLVIPTVACAYHAIRSRSKSERVEYWTYAAYMIAPLFSGLVEDIFPLVPVLALSIFMIVHILFLMIQNMQIYNDALTGLNNRRRLNQFLEECLPKASPEHPITLLMMDINGFKAINDTFGHIEGDNALRAFAQVLKTAATQSHAFIARYGGDEFCAVSEMGDCVPEKMADGIQKLLCASQDGAPTDAKRYTLSVSIGFSVCGRPEENPDAVISEADEMLYANKKEWHRSHA